MKGLFVYLLAFLVVVASAIPSGLSYKTSPAFLWSPHYHQIKTAVNYETISPKDLVKSVLSDGGWSKLLCPSNQVHQPLDLALVFVGTELQSSDISASKHADPALVDLLHDSFTQSNFSMAFPYISTPEENTMEKSILSGISDICGQDFGLSNVHFSDSCSMEGDNIQKLLDMQSIHNYLDSRVEKTSNGEADLVVVCHRGSNELEHPHPESKIFSDIISSVDHSGARYAVLYVSDPIKSIQYPSHRELERFLAESSGNASANSTGCDEVCQIKSSLLEGLLVALVLLIILISGLCCMMGIDTPTRFEAPQES